MESTEKKRPQMGLNTSTKLIFVILAILVCASFIYGIFVLAELAWILAPFGFLCTYLCIAPILASKPAKTSESDAEKIKAELRQEMQVRKGQIDAFYFSHNPNEFTESLYRTDLSKTVWILWACVGTLFIAFFHGFLGSLIWVGGTFLLITLEIITKRRSLAKVKIAQKMYHA